MPHVQFSYVTKIFYIVEMKMLTMHVILYNVYNYINYTTPHKYIIKIIIKQDVMDHISVPWPGPSLPQRVEQKTNSIPVPSWACSSVLPYLY